MKILFGIQGTGNGHVSRSTLIIKALLQKGADIDVIFSGCTRDKVYDRAVIKDPAFYEGFTFTTRNGAINYLSTIKNLSLLKFARDVINFDTRSYDLVITDFEPVSSMIARKNRLPSIGIGHQYAFLHDIPMDRSNPVSLFIIEKFAPADFSIGLHWHHFNQPIVPPIVPQFAIKNCMTDEKLILVYLPFESRDNIKSLLTSFKEYKFAVYFGDKRITAIQEEGNILWHPFSKTDFYENLKKCSGVITNAGFELPSEAIFLGKKLLVKPLFGQFEQVSNAMALDMLNLGMKMETLKKASIEKWLEKGRSIPKTFPDVADKVAGWIIKGEWTQTGKLVRETWQ